MVSILFSVGIKWRHMWGCLPICWFAFLSSNFALGTKFCDEEVLRRLVRGFTTDLIQKKMTRKTKKVSKALHEKFKNKVVEVLTAKDLNTLNNQSGNIAEKKNGKLRGWYSIRLNNRYRLIFKWNGKAQQIEVTDHYSPIK